MLDSVMFFIYRFFLMPFLKLVLPLLKPFAPAKIKETLNDRENLVWQPLSSRPIWIHAASGEIEYALSVIRGFKEKYPQSCILVTFFSPSAKSWANRLEGVDLFIPIPFDHRGDVSKFLDFYKPLVALFARTDVWPEVSYQLKKRKIPSLLFAATFAEASSRKKMFARSLTRWALNHLSEIHCVSAEDVSEIEKVGVMTRTLTAGDTRYDQVFHRLENPRKKIKFSMSSAKPLFVMGSTWPEDEEMLIPALSTWLKTGRAILVPHEIDPGHIEKICAQLSQAQMSFEIYSEARSWTSSVLIVNEFGLLQEFYKYCQVAFVGGSFKAKVHSVMEALCLNRPVIVGPFFRNNREAMEMSQLLLENKYPAVWVADSSEDIKDKLEKLTDFIEPSQILQKTINQKRFASQRTIEWIEKNITTN
jgi:3-deoxy-D-manno-octulosonic-acid transferase